jgi:Aspartyl protease
MRSLFILAVLAANGASGQAAAPSPSSATPITATMTAPRQVIPLYMSATRALVMLRIGDNAPVPVVFDTGTNGNLVDLKLATRLGLPKTGPSQSIDGSTGKPVPGYESFIKGARLGGIAIVDASATAMAYDETDEIGIFGPNSFPDRLVEMDGPKSRLVIRPKTASTLPIGPGTPYLGKGGDALPSATLDFGKLKVPAILDSGNDVPIILPLSYADKLDLQAPPVPIGFAVSAAGRQPILKARLKGSLRIANVTLEQPEIRFMAGGRPNIGLPILRRLSVVYDHSGSRSWINVPLTL